MPLTLTLHGETLGDVIDQMRFLLDTVETDEGRALLAAMDAPLPPAVRRAPKKHTVTAKQAKTATDSQAPPCSADDVRAAMRALIDKIGQSEAEKWLPGLLGASRVSDIPPDDLWRVRASILEATTIL